MTTTYLQPDETRALGVFDLAGKEAVSRADCLSAVVLAFIAWLGSLAFLAPFRPNEVWGLLSWIGPPQTVYVICFALSAIWAVVALWLRKRSAAALASAIAAYLGAFHASGYLYVLHDPANQFPFTSLEDGWAFAVSRLWLGIPAVILLGLVAVAFRPSEGQPGLHLGIGNWSVAARETSTKEAMLPYWRRLIVGFVIVAAVIAIILQALVQFAPITSGKLAALLPAIALAALVNAIVEETIYRGFLQPAFMRLAGVGYGLWISSLFFGLCHWGLSFGVLAALPVSMLIGVGSAVWGKAAYETRGIAWPIAAHFLVDLGIMSAYFV